MDKAEECMKTIKKKAENYVSGFHPSIQRICKESFEAGANYVLGQFENLLKDKNTGLVEMWDESMTLIEQLRK